MPEIPSTYHVQLLLFMADVGCWLGLLFVERKLNLLVNVELKLFLLLLLLLPAADIIVVYVLLVVVVAIFAAAVIIAIFILAVDVVVTGAVADAVVAIFLSAVVSDVKSMQHNVCSIPLPAILQVSFLQDARE